MVGQEVVMILEGLRKTVESKNTAEANRIVEKLRAKVHRELRGTTRYSDKAMTKDKLLIKLAYVDELLRNYNCGAATQIISGVIRTIKKHGVTEDT